MSKLLFGTDTTWSYVRILLSDPNDVEAGDAFRTILQRDAAQILSGSQFSYHDKEDILQTLCTDLFERFPQHMEKLEPLTMPQRNRYLKTMLQRIGYDFLQKKRKHSVALSMDDDNFSLEHCGATEDISQKVLQQDEICQLLHFVCQLDLPPEQIIAFLLTRFLADSNNCRNGKPAEVEKLLQNQMLLKAAHIAIAHIYQRYRFARDLRIYEPLMRKLDQRDNGIQLGARRFNMDSRAISVACGRISRMILKWRQDNPTP